jgi:hypothetical protein
LQQRLLELTPVVSEDLRAAWEATVESLWEPAERQVDTVPEQYLILVTCRDEKEQVELLTRLQGEGLECKALLS